MKQRSESADSLAHTGASGAGDEVAALQLELEQERAARTELLRALRDAQEAAAATERVVVEKADQGEGQNEVPGVPAARSLRLQLLASEEKCARLQIMLFERDAALIDAQRNASLEREEAHLERRSLASSLTTARELLQEAHSRSHLLERRIRELETQISEGSEYVGGLLSQMAQKEQQIAESAAYARKVEADLLRRDEAYELLAAELEAIREAAISDKQVTREYVKSLQEQVAEIPALREAEQRLISQTEEIISAVQAETMQLATLVDIVQASHFWALKRLLNRLRARVLRPR